MQQLVTEFEANGYLVIPDSLSPREIARANRAFDEDLACRPEMWRPMEPGRLDNYNVLLSTDAFDDLILKPSILRLVTALMGPDVCLDEFYLMIRAPEQHPVENSWHRDMQHDPQHPLALAYLSIMYYLTDVDDTTHCFAIVPEDVSAKRVVSTSVDGSTGREIHGPAGTAIVFNAGSLHTPVLRATPTRRRTAQVYYGTASHPCISNDTILPERFFRDATPRLARLCARTNVVTDLVRQHCRNGNH